MSVTIERLSLRIHPSPRPLDQERAMEGLPPTPRVLFLCAGNICRSPMAELYARKRSDGLAQFDSAGFLEPEGRSSPADAIDEAVSRSIDLSDHRSAQVTAQSIEDSDIVFVMDVWNYRRLRQEFPTLTDDAYFLSAFGSDGISIADPHNRGPAEFERAYDEVTTAVDGFLAALERR